MGKLANLANPFLVNEGFARRHDLKRHELLHSGVKKYICEACQQPFVRLDALQRHHKSEVSLSSHATWHWSLLLMMVNISHRMVRLAFSRLLRWQQLQESTCQAMALQLSHPRQRVRIPSLALDTLQVEVKVKLPTFRLERSLRRNFSAVIREQSHVAFHNSLLACYKHRQFSLLTLL